mmetsp:Transcript_145580/g.363079  ORF Transcript_145580/g.363079 Transcript_145580/m.363079 type:complete len:587 (-) Transcript_145580:297-2057(-)
MPQLPPAKVVGAAALELHGLDEGALHEPRVVLQDREVVQRVDVHAVGGYRARRPEGQEAITQRSRSGVAVADHQAALRVHDHASARELDSWHAVDGEGHGDRHLHQAPHELLLDCVRPARGAGLAADGACGDVRGEVRRRGRRRRGAGGPDAGLGHVAGGELHGEPSPVDPDHRNGAVGRIREARETHGDAGSVRVGGEGGLHLPDVARALPPDLGDQGARADAGASEEVALRRDVDANALDRQVVGPGLLIREVVEYGIPTLQILVRGDAVEVLYAALVLQALAPALDDQLDLLTNRIVEQCLERHEAGDALPGDGEEDVAWLEPAAGRALGDEGLDDEHADVLAACTSGRRLGLGETQPPQIRKGGELKCRLQRAPRHLLALAEQVDGALDAVQGEVEGGGGARLPSGIQGDDIAIGVYHGRPRRAARGRGSRLEVEGVEVVVGPPAVEGSLPVEPREHRAEDRKLLARIVPDYADVEALHGFVWPKLELRDAGEMLQGRGIELEDPEVMHRVAVDRSEGDLLAVVEVSLRHDGPLRDHVPVRQDEPPLRVHHEARGLPGAGLVRVEGAGAVQLEGDDARLDPR